MFSRFMGRRPPGMQVAALCRDGASGKVLLITSRGTGRWIVPKGWPMPGKTLAQAAQQEAWEEAGVRGQIDEAHIGTYHYDKVQDEGFSVPLEVRVFALTVQEVSANFPEHAQRRREWFDPDEAARLVDEPDLRKLLKALPMPDGTAA